MRLTLFLSRITLSLLALGIFSAGLSALAASPSAPNQSSVVVLTASWCATCREISPLVRRIIANSPELGLRVVDLDVDGPNAPALVKDYGINAHGADLPQVYLLNSGKTILLFNGSGYQFGQSAQAEAEIRRQLKLNY